MLPPLDGQQLKLLFHCTVSARAASALATGPASAGPAHLSGSDRANGTNQNFKEVSEMESRHSPPEYNW